MNNLAPSSRKLLEYLQSGEFEIQFSWIDKSTLARVDPASERIVINLSLHLVETFIHEYLHCQYPQLDEQAICRKTEKMLSRISEKDIRRIGEMLVNLLLTQTEDYR